MVIIVYKISFQVILRAIILVSILYMLELPTSELDVFLVLSTYIWLSKRWCETNRFVLGWYSRICLLQFCILTYWLEELAESWEVVASRANKLLRTVSCDTPQATETILCLVDLNLTFLFSISAWKRWKLIFICTRDES